MISDFLDLKLGLASVNCLMDRMASEARFYKRLRDLPSNPWPRVWVPKAGGLDMITGQATRSHLMQLRVQMPQLKIPHAAMMIEYPACHNEDLVAQMVKNLPAMQETWVRSSGWEDPLEKWMATHSSILAWEIPWTEEPGELQSMGSQRVGHDRETNTRPRCSQSN